MFRYLESHSEQVTTETQPYARLNTFSMFGAYSWISSHMFLGYAQNRQLLNIGVAYGLRLLTNRVVNRQYNAELIPVALESDPLVHSVISQQTPTVETYVADFRQWSACVPRSEGYSNTGPDGTIFSGTVTLTCNRTWTVGMAMSPIGFHWNFCPRHKYNQCLSGMVDICIRASRSQYRYRSLPLADQVNPRGLSGSSHIER